METEKNNLTPERSLAIINETLDRSRRNILRQSGTPLLLWGALLFVFSLGITILWNKTGSPAWNYLWFAMTALGFALSPLFARNTKKVPDNMISKLLGATWSAFGVFAISLALTAIFLVPFNITIAIVLLFGFAETMSGFLLKNWPVIISGFVIALGGVIASVLLKDQSSQMLVFTVGGVVLALTGLAVKLQNR